MLATLADELPTGDDWLYEVKWDGYRALGYVRGGEARLVSRNGNDLTARFPDDREGAREGGALAGLRRRRRGVRARRGRPAELLGDAAGEGRHAARLRGLRRARGRRRAASSTCRSTERRERLEALLDAARRRRCRSRAVFDDGEALYDAAIEQGLEGVMAKRPGSRYLEGRRTRDWLKIKTHGRQEFVICGYTKGQGRALGPLRRARARGRSATGSSSGSATCGTGFNEHDDRRAACEARAAASATRRRSRSSRRCRRCARATSSGSSRSSSCEVEFAEWTHDGHLRAPVVPGAARRQARARRAPRDSRSSARGPREALESRQGLLRPTRGSRRAT